jgi:GMP synthase (glutamine-hydrolysing)
VTRQPVLVVEHETDCPPGWMAEWLDELGVRLDLRRPYAGDPLPQDLDEHSGMVVLGGSMNAYDDEPAPWLPKVKELVRVAAGTRTPTLGICLGHQLAAVALGGEVVRNPRGQQVGVLTVGWTDAAGEDPLFGPLTSAPPAAQWNNDIVSRLPEGATLLAATAAGEVQAARFAQTVWGVQWHPEAGEEIIGRWVATDREGLAQRGAELNAALAQVAAAEEMLRATWRGLAESFAALVADPVAAS